MILPIIVNNITKKYNKLLGKGNQIPFDLNKTMSSEFVSKKLSNPLLNNLLNIDTKSTKTKSRNYNWSRALKTDIGVRSHID